MNAVQELHITIPELRGAIWELGSCHDLEVGIDGPAGTGKTFGILYYIHNLLWMYPGAKWLVTRMYNTDLSGSAMATYRDDVLHPSEGVQYFGGNKVEPASYRYPNGSRLLVSGLDRATKVKSLEVDGIYINEATECDIERIEFCRMRLRKGKMPFQQLIMDFNPDAPTHHLNVRMNDGITTRLLSRHEDNPRYWDARANDWTEEGRRYVLGTLEGLTGVRKARYRHGLWQAAEGMVYENEWDPRLHIIDRFDIPDDWPRYWVIDFGFRNPFVWQAWAENHDGELFRYLEIYRTESLVEDLAEEIKQLTANEPRPKAIICDHDLEDRMTFEKHTRLRTIAAKKAVSTGIQEVQSRLRRGKNGRAGMYFLRDSLVGKDKSLENRKLPYCTEQEFLSYVWNIESKIIKEEPVKEFDHGMDATRYLAMFKSAKSAQNMIQELEKRVKGAKIA